MIHVRKRKLPERMSTLPYKGPRGYFSKYSPWPIHPRITWELVKLHMLRPSPRPQNQAGRVWS